jgi:ribosomal protein S18 acetylase RimI-like enzyme
MTEATGGEMPTAHTARSHLPAHFTAADLPIPLSFGGHRCLLRWLGPDDAGRLMEFFRSHSEETKYERYGCAGAQMPPERAAQLVGVDQSRDAALGVFELGDPRQPLIAIGRYCLAANGRSAEAAFVVHEERRQLGIGTTLCAALLAIARERKLDRLVAQVRQGNVPMIHVFRATGAAFEWINGAPELKVTMLLPATEGVEVAAAGPELSAAAALKATAGARARPSSGGPRPRTYLD